MVFKASITSHVSFSKKRSSLAFSLAIGLIQKCLSRDALTRTRLLSYQTTKVFHACLNLSLASHWPTIEQLSNQNQFQIMQLLYTGKLIIGCYHGLEKNLYKYLKIYGTSSVDTSRCGDSWPWSDILLQQKSMSSQLEQAEKYPNLSSM